MNILISIITFSNPFQFRAVRKKYIRSITAVRDNELGPAIGRPKA